MVRIRVGVSVGLRWIPQRYSSVSGIFVQIRICKDIAEAHGIHLQFSGVEAQNAIGEGERYHIPLRRVFRISLDRYPSLDPEVTLRYTVKALNDTMGPEGMIPSILVFGTLPTLPTGDNNNGDQAQRMGVIETART